MSEMIQLINRLLTKIDELEMRIFHLKIQHAKELQKIKGE